MISDKEKRKVERFLLELPGQISVVEDKDQRILDLLTRDVCAGGAFFYTDQPLPVGTEVKVDLVLLIERLKKLSGSKALLKISGKVIRHEGNGMAVCFEEDYDISPLPKKKNEAGL